MRASRTFAARVPIVAVRNPRARRAPVAPGGSSASPRRAATGLNQHLQRPPIDRARVAQLTAAPLPVSTRQSLEAFFRRDLSAVRVHAGADAHAAARDARARAFTLGTDVVFAQGRYAPDTAVGRRLLAHEVAHAVAHQQRGQDQTVHREADEAASRETAPDEMASCGDVAHDHPQIQSGSVGVAVGDAQCKLNRVSTRMQDAGEGALPDTPLAVDAIFGPHTRNAVLGFQRHVFPLTPVEWDGIVGPKTWAALDAAAGARQPPQFCPRPGSSAAEPGDVATFADGVPDLEPCGPGSATQRPPPLKQMILNVRSEVIGEATASMKPHLHLGVPVRLDPKGVGTQGIHFHGEVADGGPGTGGEIFFSQVVRDSNRRIRVGTDLSEEKVKDQLDNDAQFGTARMPVGPGRNPPVTSGDTPGSSISSKREKARFTFNFHDQFELFLMWRPKQDSPTSEWLSYGSLEWEWEGVATGVSADSPLNWAAPIEPFEVCDASRRTASRLAPAKNTSGMPVKPAHLGLPVNAVGNTPLNLKPTFKDPVAREKGLDDC